MSRESMKKQEPLFGSWKMGELLGEGSFGEVYKLYREDFGEVYESALKVITVPKTRGEIKSALSDGMDEESVTTYFYSVVEDLVQEIALMSKIKGYTNIVNYEDHMVIPHEGEIGWDILIRMELLTPLVEYSTVNDWNQKEVLKLGIDICKALEVCRSEDIIHRDIKPENIFINKNGDFKLGDFGIAKMMEKAAVAMSQKGTYSYMAPEVYLGREYGFSVDLYSLGLVMYRFLNQNRLPFYPEYPQPITVDSKEKAFARRMKGEAIPPIKGVNEELNRLILKMTAFHEEERIRDPKEIRLEMERILMESGEDTGQRTFGVYPEREMSRTQEFEEEKTAALIQRPEEEEKTVSLYGSDDRTVFMEPEPPVKKKNYVIKKQQKKKFFYRIAGAGTAVIFIALIAAGIFLNQKISVPNYVSLSYEDAGKAAKEDGFSLKISKKAYSDEFAEGIVIRQEQKPGEKKKKGSVIKVVVSKGEGSSVAQYVGMTFEEAKKAAEKEGLMIEVEKEEYSDQYQEGVVISQDQKAGKKMAPGGRIKVILSKGSEEVTASDAEEEENGEEGSGQKGNIPSGNESVPITEPAPAPAPVSEPVPEPVPAPAPPAAETVPEDPAGEDTIDIEFEVE